MNHYPFAAAYAAIACICGCWHEAKEERARMVGVTLLLAEVFVYFSYGN